MKEDYKMSEIIYKPMSVISKEWGTLCEKYSEALKKTQSIQNSSNETYPPGQWWDMLSTAQNDLIAIKAEMDNYTSTVRIAD